MARFDLHRARTGSARFLLDVQAETLAHLRTRVVVPLMPPHAVPEPIRDLHPLFRIEGAPLVMATQFLGAIPRAELGPAIASLAAERDAITRALDLLLTGF